MHYNYNKYITITSNIITITISTIFSQKHYHHRHVRCLWLQISCTRTCLLYQVFQQRLPDESNSFHGVLRIENVLDTTFRLIFSIQPLFFHFKDILICSLCFCFCVAKSIWGLKLMEFERSMFTWVVFVKVFISLGVFIFKSEKDQA